MLSKESFGEEMEGEKLGDIYHFFPKINTTSIINMYINPTLNALQLLLIPFIMVNIFKNPNYTPVFKIELPSKGFNIVIILLNYYYE